MADMASVTSPHWALLNDVSMRYAVSGAKGRPLLLLHEMGGSLESWDPVIQYLPDDRLILRCDMRGAGGSEKIRTTVNCAQLADDIAALLDHLGFDQVDVAGVALGGCLGLHLAIQHPSRVSSLMAINPPVDARGRAGEVLQKRAVEAETRGMRGITDATMERSYPDSYRADASAYQAYVARFLTNDPVSYAYILRALIAVDLDKKIEQISCPTVCVAGRDDFVRPPEGTRAVAARIPGAAFQEIDGGHIPSVQAPAAVASVLKAFFDHA